LADSLVREEFFREALDYYRLAAERDPDPVAGLVRLGDAYLKQDFVTLARESYLQALDLAPGDPAAEVGLGRTMLAVGQRQEAEEIFNRHALGGDPYPPARYYLARSFVTTERNFDQAEQLLRDYLAGHLNFHWPSRAVANWQLALAQEKTGRYDQAWQTMSLAMSLPLGNDQMKSDAQRMEFMAKD
nr:tetratricopeptide repeat protein [Candidatus Krumholzibacteria bacterium]